MIFLVTGEDKNDVKNRRELKTNCTKCIKAAKKTQKSNNINNLGARWGTYFVYLSTR